MIVTIVALLCAGFVRGFLSFIVKAHKSSRCQRELILLRRWTLLFTQHLLLNVYSCLPMHLLRNGNQDDHIVFVNIFCKSGTSFKRRKQLEHLCQKWLESVVQIKSNITICSTNKCMLVKCIYWLFTMYLSIDKHCKCNMLKPRQNQMTSELMFNTLLWTNYKSKYE